MFLLLFKGSPVLDDWMLRFDAEELFDKLGFDWIVLGEILRGFLRFDQLAVVVGIPLSFEVEHDVVVVFFHLFQNHWPMEFFVRDPVNLCLMTSVLVI